MVFIDWISTPDHLNFNRSFFSALELVKARCYIFLPDLTNECVECVVVNDNGGRLVRLFNVLLLCWRHRGDKIVFVTYDALFLPLVRFFCSQLYLFEHNTTPEKFGWSKHVIWQRLFFRNIKRLAQFPAQSQMLEAMKQNVSFVGTPVMYQQKSDLPRRCSKGYYLAPSWRVNISQLNLVKTYLGGSMIFVKKGVYDSVLKDFPSLEIVANIKAVDYLDIAGSFENILGVIVTVDSRIRGTGWFNDSLAYGLPIITTNSNASSLFEESFPGHPFIDITDIVDEAGFDTKRNIASEFDTELYLRKHNGCFRKRFLESLF